MSFLNEIYPIFRPLTLRGLRINACRSTLISEFSDRKWIFRGEPQTWFCLPGQKMMTFHLNYFQWKCKKKTNDRITNKKNGGGFIRNALFSSHQSTLSTQRRLEIFPRKIHFHLRSEVNLLGTRETLQEIASERKTKFFSFEWLYRRPVQKNNMGSKEVLLIHFDKTKNLKQNKNCVSCERLCDYKMNNKTSSN